MAARAARGGWKSALRRLLHGLRLEGIYALRDRLRRWDPRRMALERRFRRAGRAAAPGEMALRPGLVLPVDARARESFEWFCFRSPEMARELDAFLRHMRDRRRFLDVGACHGIFSLAFAHHRPDAKALALEPSGIAFDILKANAAAQTLANVLPRQAACGAAPGTLRMRQVWHHLEALAPGENGEAETKGAAADADLATVPLTTVDALCADLSFAPDLMKVDVEGYELAVLQGARATLERHRPLLFLEVHPARLHELGGSLTGLLELLESLGYRFYDLRDAPLAAARVAARREVSRLICRPE